ncbi:MAG: DUF881 domain-containing protein [Actinomycetales bacterium]|nr:DUF881 domain-containing protein [Actinomycetales bacterium]
MTADQPERPEPTTRESWRVLLRSLRPQARPSHLLVGLLCMLLGFALVTQVRHTQSSGLSALRQSDLVQLLEETTDHSRELRGRVAELQRTRDELASGTNQQQAALEAATERASTLGVLSGRLPAVGPGVVLTLNDANRALAASAYVTVLTELRNAGAEAVQVDGRRVTAETFFLDGPDGVLVDGVLVGNPATWLVIGDSHTISQALEIPGGALALVRSQGATAGVRVADEVEITVTRTPRELRFASPVEAGS